MSYCFTGSPEMLLCSPPGFQIPSKKSIHGGGSGGDGGWLVNF